MEQDSPDMVNKIEEEYTCDNPDSAIESAKAQAFKRMAGLLGDGKIYRISFQESVSSEYGEEFTGLCVIQFEEII